MTTAPAPAAAEQSRLPAVDADGLPRGHPAAGAPRARRVGAGMRIGEVAAQLGVSPRTLRYYEELGLLRPSSKTAGGARRYSEAEVERLLRIRDLQELLGFNLEEIRVVL